MIYQIYIFKPKDNVFFVGIKNSNIKRHLVGNSINETYYYLGRLIETTSFANTQEMRVF